MNSQRPGPNGPIEPSAEHREMAGNLRQMYLALLEQGFTEQEAFTIVGITLSAAFGRGSS